MSASRKWLQYAAKTGFEAASTAAWGRLPLSFLFVVNLNALTTRFVRWADGVYSTDSLTARN